MIEIKDVCWTYAGAATPALDGFTLRVQRGETLVLCGASGSGKSTALRLMNGLIPHFHEGSLDGMVHVDGLPVAQTPLDELGRRTGTVLQHPRRQFFTADVAAEIAFAMENFGTEPGQIRRQVAAVADEHDLAALARRRLGELSGGQQQRVACAAAVAHRPPLVLFDEPTSNLSAAAIGRFTTALRRLRDAGTTVVITEHRLHFLREVADRVVVMRDGRVDAEWTAPEFARLDDETLAAQGLRGARSAACLTLDAASAGGASVARQAGPPPPAHAARRPARRGITVENVRCGFRGDPVLEIDHAHLPAGAVTAIRGPNGVGKTTLARIITGLQRHDGTIRLNGQPLSRAQRQRCSTLVMQDVQRQLFTDSVTAELSLHTPAGAPDAAPVEALLRGFDLHTFGERHPLSLSGGQQQRLAIAAARLAGRPVVVFDEPSSGVDRRHLVSIARAIRDLATGGAVVLVISHDDDLLSLGADRVLTLTPLVRAGQPAPPPGQTT